MATEKKSIEISYKANLADLKAKLKTIPNITDAEAKKMVAALDRQLKQAEKAAKKSADASKKAAKEAAMAARKGSSDFDKMGAAAARAEQRLEGVADASGDIDRGFSSVGLALRNVNPQLAEAADGLADAFAVGEGLVLTFTALNPIVIAGAAAIGALTLGYISHKAELEKVKELTLEYREAQKSLADAQKASQANLEDAASTFADLRERLKLLTGEISEYEYATIQAQRSAFEGIQDNILAQEKLITEKKREMDLVKRLQEAAMDSSKPAVILSELQTQQVRDLQLQTKAASNKLDLTKRDLKEAAALSQVYATAENQLKEMERSLEALTAMQDASVEMAGQIAEFEHEQANETERQARAKENQKEKQEKLLKQAELEAKILEDMERFRAKQAESEQAILDARERLSEELIKITGSEEDRINLKYDKEIERLEELAAKAEEVDGVKEAIAQLETEREQQLQKLKMDNFREQQRKAVEVGQDIQGAYSNMLNGIADLVESNAKDEAKAASRVFALRQGAALAETTMNTAKGIVNALATYPGPVGIALSGIIGATGAAQAGVILSQQPPSFHMGGLASDEANARVLKGEAVLDRATVRRIGGEQGVKQLQQGGASNNNVVIVQPFKHFGRFAREIGFKKPKQTGMRGY